VEVRKVLWDGWLPVMEERSVTRVVDDESEVVTKPRRWFSWGRDVSGGWDGAGGLVSIYEEGGRTLLPVDDGLGNIMAVVNAATGAVVAKYDHGPYGEVWGAEGEVDACPFRYQSKYYDADAGLYYFGYRYYSPKMGRWISRDPMGEVGGFNLYAYCMGDPVNMWDYLGLSNLTVVKGGSGLVAYMSGSVIYQATTAEELITLLISDGHVLDKGDYKRIWQASAFQMSNDRPPSAFEKAAAVPGLIMDGTVNATLSLAGGAYGGDALLRWGSPFRAAETLGLAVELTPEQAHGLSGSFNDLMFGMSGIRGPAQVNALMPSSRWLGRQRFDPSNLTLEQLDQTIMKSIRRKSGATGNPSQQIVADADQMEFILNGATYWRRNVLAQNPRYSNISSYGKGTVIHSNVANQMQGLNIADLSINKRLYGTSQFVSPLTGLPYVYRIPDYRLPSTIFDIKTVGTPIGGPQVIDFMNFGNTQDVRFIFYQPW